LRTLFLLAVAAVLGTAQTTAPAPAPAPSTVADVLSSVKLPTYLFLGGRYDQFLGANIVGSAIVPESQSTGMFGTLTFKVSPIGYTDPTSKKTGYLLGYSASAGQCKQLYPTPGTAGKNVILLCADVGATFSATSVPSSGTTVNFTGSVSPGYMRQLNSHFAVGGLLRLSYIAGAGPGGSGALDVAPEAGIIWKPGP
jgi:hypothetical protein